MTKRNEKPSPSESSTDTLIDVLNIIADLLDTDPDQQYMIEAISVREAAQRLDLLEREIDKLRGGDK